MNPPTSATGQTSGSGGGSAVPSNLRDTLRRYVASTVDALQYLEDHHVDGAADVRASVLPVLRIAVHELLVSTSSQPFQHTGVSAVREPTVADPVVGVLREIHQAIIEGARSGPSNEVAISALAAKRPASIEKRLLSKRAVAKQLGIDRGRTLDTLIESRQIRTVQRNGKTAIPLSEVERLASEGFDIAIVRPRTHRVRPTHSKKTKAVPPSKWNLKTR